MLPKGNHELTIPTPRIRFEEVLRPLAVGRIRKPGRMGRPIVCIACVREEGCDTHRSFLNFVPEWESEFTRSWGVVLCSMILVENHDPLL